MVERWNFDAGVTESGESFPSDFYEGGLFFFAPPNGTKGNTYNCSIDPSTIPDECSGRELPGNVTLIIDEDIVKLSAVEHRIRHLEAQLREEQTENAAIRHELDIVKGNLTDIISSFTAQLEALRAGN
nr:hypothetical protein BaRGS_010188 [Batillaria attramentaria]